MKESKWSATHVRAVSLLLLIGALSTVSLAAPGDVDLSFDAGSGVNGGVTAIALQPDGKLIIGGGFTTVKGLVRTGIARLNADGCGDSTFSFPRFTSGFGSASAIALQSDGRILVAQSGIFRLYPDGSRDTNFAPSVVDDNFNPARVDAIAIQPDGKILIGGGFRIVNGQLRSSIARLNADGTLDTAFVPETVDSDFTRVNSIALQADGKVLIGGYYLTVYTSAMARLNADGSMETDVRPVTEEVYALALQPDGKVLIASGSFANVARRNADLSLDTSFHTPLGGYTLALRPDGKVLVGAVGLTRLNADGTLDNTFDLGPGPHPIILAIAQQPDGKILLGGGGNNVANYDHLIRVNANGSRDGTFVAGGGVEGDVFSVAVQPDGKTLIAGALRFVNGISRNAVARLHADGRLDTTFIPDAAIYNLEIVQLQPDGKLLVGGAFYLNGLEPSNRVARLNADGSLDGSFDIGSGFDEYGYVREIALQADGKVMIGGGFRTVNGTNRVGLARLNSNGSLDTAFQFRMVIGTEIHALAVQPDGKVLIGGAFQIENDPNLYGFARLNVDGSLDGSFQHGITQGATNLDISRIQLQPDGKVLISGRFNAVHTTQRFRIARLRADGSVDPTFDAGEGASPGRLALQPDGKILVSGSYYPTNGDSLNGVFRLHADGRLDSSYQTPRNTYNPGPNAMAFQPDGNLIIGGGFLAYAGVVRPYVARLYGDSARPALNIARSNNLAVLSWPAAFGNFQLQENTNVSLVNGWSAVAGTRSTNDSFISVALPATGSRKFFRLSSP